MLGVLLFILKFRKISLHFWTDAEEKSFLDTFGHPKYTHKTWKKSNIGNKSYRASNFQKYADVVDVDSISWGGIVGGCVCLSMVGFFHGFTLPA